MLWPIVFQTLAMLLTALILPGLKVDSIFGAIAMVVVLSFVNQTLWSGALFYMIPDNLTAQTLQIVLINGFLFWALVKVLPGISSNGILAPLLAPIVYTFLTGVVHQYGSQVDWEKLWTETQTTVQGVRSDLEKGRISTSSVPTLPLSLERSPQSENEPRR